jgi:3-hydroxyacyl-[acyl-carrier-protein] dehydratase
MDKHLFMLDRVIELLPGKSITAIKDVSMNEGFFEGHFPQMPVMPGALIVEAMCEAAGLLFGAREGALAVSRPGLRSLKVKFTHPVFPGDQLKITVTLTGKDNSVSFIAEAQVGQKQAARAELGLSD